MPEAEDMRADGRPTTSAATTAPADVMIAALTPTGCHAHRLFESRDSDNQICTPATACSSSPAASSLNGSG